MAIPIGDVERQGGAKEGRLPEPTTSISRLDGCYMGAHGGQAYLGGPRPRKCHPNERTRLSLTPVRLTCGPIQHHPFWCFGGRSSCRWLGLRGGGGSRQGTHWRYEYGRAQGHLLAGGDSKGMPRRLRLPPSHPTRAAPRGAWRLEPRRPRRSAHLPPEHGNAIAPQRDGAYLYDREQRPTGTIVQRRSAVTKAQASAQDRRHPGSAVYSFRIELIRPTRTVADPDVERRRRFIATERAWRGLLGRAGVGRNRASARWSILVQLQDAHQRLGTLYSLMKAIRLHDRTGGELLRLIGGKIREVLSAGRERSRFYVPHREDRRPMRVLPPRAPPVGHGSRPTNGAARPGPASARPLQRDGDHVG